MQWVDHETYVGPCRRIAQRPHLRHRRRKNIAQPFAPNPRELCRHVTFAQQLGQGCSARTLMRIEAGIDLADRLGDQHLAGTFRQLRADCSPDLM